MNKSITFVISAVLTAVLLVAVASAEAAPTAPPDSVERALLGLNATEPHNELLPDFGPEVFEKMKNDSKILATYGKIPIIKIESEKRNWLERLEEIWTGGRDKINAYFYPAGPVITYGVDYEGYLVVTLKDNSSKTLMDEIYKLLYDQAAKKSISEVPVVFESGDLPQLDTDWRSETEKKADEEYERSGRGLYKPDIIGAYGKLPEFKTEEQRWNWLNREQPEIMEALGDKITPYFTPAGPLVAFGTNREGYFEATVYKNLTVERSKLDEIYRVIDEEAKKIGINEIPVRFILGDFARPLDDEATSPSMAASNKSVSGFVLLGGLISLLGVWLLRRR